MQKLSIREMRNALGHLDTLVNAAGELVVTRHGEAIARILPIHGNRARPTHEELHKLTKKSSISSEKMLREFRDER